MCAQGVAVFQHYLSAGRNPIKALTILDFYLHKRDDISDSKMNYLLIAKL